MRLVDTGNGLAIIGTVSFLIACAATATALVLAVGRRAWPGAAVLVAAAVPFLYSHIYWPVGVLTLVGLAIGLAEQQLHVTPAGHVPAALTAGGSDRED